MRSVILFIAVMFLSGCVSDSSIERALEDANRYADNGEPGKSLEILDSLGHTDKMNQKERMYAELLRVKALDKSDIIPTNDSTIRRLLHYYIDEGNDKDRHALALYYAGRTYTELKDAPKALLYFHKALDACQEDKDPYLCSYIHSQMAGLFDKRRLYKMALRHHTKELELEELLKDSINMVYTQTHRAYCYIGMGEKDSAENIYKNLLDFVSKLNDRSMDYFLRSQTATFSMYEGRYAEADSLLRSMPEAYNSYSMPTIKSILNAIDMEKGDYDDVKSSSLNLIKNGDIFTRRKAAENLAEIYLSENNLEEGLKYARMYKAMSDTITHNDGADYIAEMEAIYDYSETERENLQLKLENETKNAWLWFVCALAFLAAGAGIFFYFRHRLRETSMRLRIEENRREYSEYLRAKDREIFELKDYIEAMKNELKSQKDEMTAFENRFRITEVSAAVIEKASKEGGRVTNDDFISLQKAMEMENPAFISRLRQMNLKERDFRDAMLIALKVPLKICADMLTISPQGMANSRKRLFEKLADGSGCKNWQEYIHRLYTSPAELPIK